MNMMNFYVGNQRKICNEIRAWSKHALEVKNDNFNGLPACPFAKKAWKDDKVTIIFKESEHYQDLYTVISTFTDVHDLIIIADTCYKPLKEFHNYIDSLNEAIADWVGYTDLQETLDGCIEDGHLQTNFYKKLFLKYGEYLPNEDDAMSA